MAASRYSGLATGTSRLSLSTVVSRIFRIFSFWAEEGCEGDDVSIKVQVCVGECGDQASESLARRVGYMRR
jgi:hypothetical protein